ncbi:hypothetical protein PPSIR1_13260 [Plesiocystis pacifica SIR-1]|uniref:Fibrinogen C-terminal domain-containing protein n=1 Tax=Plesiocystis pacifica SIR-1 TaxID=391625 RepID=A6GAZ9_9BACT|nr:fibrinogen-like YCDxxxxGGGW domain-containing protein [Plesiocystis pacifica]EDM76984.1 hypothetical protein PPSIR1_13260 [Plesiocystis pacifica SIR-1]
MLRAAHTLRSASLAALVGLPLAACGSSLVESATDGADEVGSDASDSEDDADVDADAGSSESGTDTDTDTDTGTDSTETEATDTDSSSESEAGSTEEESSSESEDTETGCEEQAECAAGNCVNGECLQVVSCQELQNFDPLETLPSGVYELDPDGPGPAAPYAAYCEFDLFGGGWTLVLKADGGESNLGWDAPQWTSGETFNPGFPDRDRSEALLASYTSVEVSELLIGVESPVLAGAEPLVLKWETLPLPQPGASLHELIAPGEWIETDLGRDTWKSLIANSSLQSNCNREGLNARNDNDSYAKVRVGIITNEQDNCNTPDAWLGVGGDYPGGCGIATDGTVGNFAGCQADNGTQNLYAFALVFVR